MKLSWQVDLCKVLNYTMYVDRVMWLSIISWKNKQIILLLQ